MASIHLLLVDPQNDFCDIGPDRQPAHPLRSGERLTPALPVTGADADMQRVARWLRENLDRVSRIHVTLDSHQPFDIAHPSFWRDAHGVIELGFLGGKKVLSPTRVESVLSY